MSRAGEKRTGRRAMANWLVTGGCGFIGSHLVEALLRRGDTVRVLDDLSSGKRSNIPGEVDLIVGDIADSQVVADAVAGVAGIFHLAAIASVERCRQDWLGCHRTNLTGTIAIFEAAGASGPARPSRSSTRLRRRSMATSRKCR